MFLAGKNVYRIQNFKRGGKLLFDEIQSSKELKLLQGAGHFPIEEKGLKQLEEYCIAFMNR